MDKKLMKLFLECPNVIREVILTEHQRALVLQINEVGYMDARRLADILNCTIQNSSGQLKNLWRRKYLNRKEIIAQSGGIEYRYTCAIQVSQPA